MSREGGTRAVVSLGTNTARLLIVRDLAGGRVEQLERGSIGTRLGEGLEHGALGAEAMRRTLDAAATFMERVRSHGSEVSCIGTSAMRRASNGAEFGRRVEAAVGSALRVLDGREEAACSFAGATFEAGAREGERLAVIDVGGGSTECAVGRKDQLEDAASLEIGAVRLAERFPATMGDAPEREALAAAGRARTVANETVRSLARFTPVDGALAVGGNPLTIAAVLHSVDVDSASGRTVRRNEIEALVERMLSIDLAGRRALKGMVAQRADILPAGGIILCEVLRALSVDAVRPEANDLLLGYLLRTRAGGRRA